MNTTSQRPASKAALARTLALLSVFAVQATAGQAFAQDAAETPEQARAALDKKKQELDAAEDKAQALRDAVADIDAERERLQGQMQETAALIQRTEGQMTSIEGRLSELEAQEKLVRGSLSQRHDQIAGLLAALQRMGRNPPPVLVTRREDALEMVRSAMLLSATFPELKGQAVALADRLDELVRVMTGIRTESERLKSETARLNEARNKLAGLMEAKKLTLADRQAELASVRAATADISKNVGDLSELIGKLDKSIAANTTLGGYQQERSRQVVTPPPPQVTAAISDTAAAEAAPPVAEVPGTETQVAALAPPPQLKPKVIELAPSKAAFGSTNLARIKPAMPFASAHAKLPLPAQGRRVLGFGERTQYGANSKGIVIETRSGAQITSPCDGWIVYAGEFRSYGQLLIINAGDGYHVLLAGMSQIDAVPGQFVLAAEPIGTMSGAAKSPQTVQANAPVLYVEFRKDGRPIDPAPWWVAGQQKVQE